MSDNNTRDELAAVLADAICGEKPSYSPDQACTAHQIQARRAADALLTSPAFARLLDEARAEERAKREIAVLLAEESIRVEERERAALNDEVRREQIRMARAEAWDEGWDARAKYIGTDGGHYRGRNPFRTGADQ